MLKNNYYYVNGKMYLKDKQNFLSSKYIIKNNIYTNNFIFK